MPSDHDALLLPLRHAGTQLPAGGGFDAWVGNTAAILNDVTDAIALLDADGNIRTWNTPASEMLGYSSEALIGRPARTLLADDRASDQERIDQQLRRFGRASRIETEVVAEDGERIPVSMTQTRLLDGDGCLVGFSLVLRDRRERENMQRQLLRADRLATLGLLASTVAHEVGTPLNVILGRAEMLEQSLAGNEAAHRQVAAITTQIQRISAVVSRLLLFSRDAHLGDAPVDLNRVLEEVVAFVEPRLHAHKVRLTIELEPRLPSLKGDPGHFHQVFLNLVMNAIDAMPNGGELKLRTSTCSGEVQSPNIPLDCHCLRAEVSDTGSGITASDLKKIFEPFFTTKRGGKGTGLGLAIADEIIRRYQGQLQVDSKLGVGTRFLVNLPRDGHGGGIVS